MPETNEAGPALPEPEPSVAATGASEFNILQNNGPGAHQAVFHVHFHIIPRPSKTVGLGIHWEPIEDAPDPAELAERLRAVIAEEQR